MLSRYDLVKNFPNGDRYVGEATDCNIKDGKGAYTWGSGATYVGEWKKDAMHGKGTWRVPGTEGYEYEGPFVSGMRQGVGKCSYNSGRRYEGSWVANECCGDGVLHGGPADLFDLYTGPFRSSVPHGDNGEMRYRNGDTFRGEWASGVRHGYGSFTSPSGSAHDVMQYEGTFVQDVPTGRGAMTFRNGSRYEGDHHNYSPHGQGTQLIPQSDVRYDGSFRNGKRHGQGTLASSKWSYSGKWAEGLRHGWGKLMSDDGIAGLRATHETLGRFGGILQYEGSWAEDEMEGAGKNVAHFASGAVYEGDMKRSQPSGHGALRRGTMVLSVQQGTKSLVMQLEYQGAFLDGLPHGEGKGSWSLSGAGAVDPAALVDENGNPSLISYAQLPATFAGAWSRGYPHGAGEMEWSALGGGGIYKGLVRSGLLHVVTDAPAGGGVLTWRSGANVRAEYRGGFLDGLRSGPSGRMRYQNDDVYDGGWVHDLRHGEGKYFQSETNNSYSGHWKDGLYHGNGKEIIYGKEFYHGDFQNGLRHGNGLLKYTNDALRYEGGFAYGLFEGLGVLELPAQGKRHAGSFSQGLCHGLVETKFSNGNVYHGNYIRGESCGEGTMKYTNGDSYSGGFAPGEVRHGAGVFYFAGGAKLECTWDKNVVHGHGKHTDHTGVVQLRHYVDGHHNNAAAAAPLNEADSEKEQPHLVSVKREVAGDPTPLQESDYEVLDDERDAHVVDDTSKWRSSSPGPAAVLAPPGASSSPPRVLPLSLAGLRAPSHRERSGGQPTPTTTEAQANATVPPSTSQELEDRIEAAMQRIAHLNASIRSTPVAEGKRAELLKATRTREVQGLLKLVAFQV